MSKSLVAASFAIALLAGCATDSTDPTDPNLAPPEARAEDPGLGVGAVELASIDVDPARRVRLYGCKR